MAIMRGYFHIQGPYGAKQILPNVRANLQTFESESSSEGESWADMKEQQKLL